MTKNEIVNKALGLINGESGVTVRKFIQMVTFRYLGSDKCTHTVLLALDSEGTIWQRDLDVLDGQFTEFYRSVTEPKPAREKKEKGDNPLAERPNDVSVETWVQFKAVRKAKRSPLTKRALSTIREESVKANMSLEKALLMCLDKGWQGFKAEWLEPALNVTFQALCPNRVRKEGKAFLQQCGRPAERKYCGKMYCRECHDELMARGVQG